MTIPVRRVCVRRMTDPIDAWRVPTPMGDPMRAVTCMRRAAIRRGRSDAKHTELCVSDVLVQARPEYDRVVGGVGGGAFKAWVAAAIAFSCGCVPGGATTIAPPSKSAAGSVESA